jgi:hypothetical protein
MRAHDFLVNDEVVAVTALVGVTVGRVYVVLETGFWSVKIKTDFQSEQWIHSGCFAHVPKVTIVKKHLRRLVLK